MPLKIALLASGTGSNAKAIIHAIKSGQLDAEVQCVIANISDAPVLEMAQQEGITTLLIPHQGLSRETHEQQILEALKPFEINYLVLAGYMRLLTPILLNTFKDQSHYRIVNIHPSLLPAFPGTHGYDDAFHYGVKVSGVTVHLVDEAMDHGPILAQASFSRYDEDTLETFKARGLALEHELYPQALQWIAEGRLAFRTEPHTQRTVIEVKSHVPC